MADFPPAQYIDGYTATGDTISFTIAGYTGKKVASVTVTDGGTYTTPSASVAFSGGSGSGVTATANMGLKTLSFSSVGASSLLQTSQPEFVQITTSDGLGITPLFGLATLSPNANMFFDVATTPTVTVSGQNGTYSDASVSLDSSSSLHVASISTPYTPNDDGDFEQGNAGSGSYPVSASVPVQIVDASNTNTVLGTATINTNSAGRIDAQTIFTTSWNTAESKSTLNGLSLKLKMTQPYYLVTGYEIHPTNRTVYFRTDGALQPTVFIGATSPYGSSASFTVNTNDVIPATFKDVNTGNIYVPDANILIRTSNNNTHVANLGTGDSECEWIASPMPWTTVNSSVVVYNAFLELDSNGSPVAQLTIYTAKKNGSNAITYNGGGKYATDVSQASATNIYSNPDGTGDISGYLNVYSEPNNEISNSAFAIKAFKMPISTASSRISVITAGSGYTEKLQVSSTGLYTEAELVNTVESQNYNQMLILNNSNIPSSGNTYTSSSSIAITGGGLTDSNIVKTPTFKVNSVTITNGGTGYTTPPAVIFPARTYTYVRQIVISGASDPDFNGTYIATTVPAFDSEENVIISYNLSSTNGRTMNWDSSEEVFFLDSGQNSYGGPEKGFASNDGVSWGVANQYLSQVVITGFTDDFSEVNGTYNYSPDYDAVVHTSGLFIIAGNELKEIASQDVFATKADPSVVGAWSLNTSGSDATGSPTTSSVAFYPSGSISGAIQIAQAETSATGTSALSVTPAISLPNLVESEADPTTGDFREICHAICELVNKIDTQSVQTSVQTTLQPEGVGIINKFTFTFDLAPETGVLSVEEES